MMKATLIAILALALPASAFAQVVQLGTVGQSVQAGSIGIIIPPSGGTPTPTPIAPTPTPTATPTPVGGVLPDGVSSPQSGSWHVQVNDNFNADSSINTGLWNGGPGGPNGGYYPMCHPGGVTDCYSNSGTIDDCLGYAGLDSAGQECGQVYTAQNGAGVSLSSQGLLVQAYTNYPNSNYFGDEWAGLQDYGYVNIQPGSFVEWQAQMPHDNSGEGDGLHTDLICVSNSRVTLTTGDELDVAEKVGGTGSSNHSSVTAAIFGGGPDGGTNLLAPGNNYFYSAPGNPDLTNSMHTYGVWWKTGGGASGQFQIYIDGHAVFSPVSINDPGWLTGLYCQAGWMQQSSGWNGGNGSVLDSSTQNNDPLIVRYFRYWTQG